MKKIWVNKADSFREAERFERDYYLAMGASKRLEEMQLLRQTYYKINPSTSLGMVRGNGELSRTKKRRGYEGRKRFRRVIKIIQ